VTAILRRYAPLAIFALAWELYVHSGFASDFLPSLERIARALVALFGSGDVAQHALSSLLNLCCGLTLSIIVGVSIGIGMARSAVVEALVGPIVKSLYPIPKSALIPILIMWLGLGNPSKVAAVFIGCLLPIVTSAYNGARGIEKVLLWSAASSGARPIDLTFDVALPGAMPEILAGIRNALALSFVLLVSSELLIGQRGLGYLISFLGDGGNYDGMFAAVLLITLIGFLADRLYLYAMRRMLAWR